MSKFLSYYNLFPIPDPKEFLGIAADSEEGNVVTTLARNVAIILNITTQKQLHSWSMPEKLSAKVIYDRQSQKYVGVFGNHALRQWDLHTPDVAKCKKLKFQKSIAHLVATETEALVLYSDGKCEPLSQALVSRKDQQEDTAEQLALAARKTITKPTVHTLPQGQQQLTYFEETRATGELELVRCSLAPRSTRRYSIKRDMVRLTGYAVVEGDEVPQLLTIWSDKRIFMLSLADRTTERSPGQFVSMLAELNVESKLSVHGVSRNFVAIYGANYGQEGASLLVYNTQFKVVNSKQYFKVYLDFSRLWSRGEHILLAMGQNITAVRYRMSRELLVDMLGSQFSDTQQSCFELDHINEEESLESAIKLADSTSDTAAKRGKINKSSSLPPADGKKVAFESPEIFNCELSELIKQHVHGELAHFDNGIEEINMTLMSNYFDIGPQNSAVQAIVRQLERSGAGEQEITEKLLTLFIKTQNSEHVLMCLRRYTNISERMLAWSLRYALDNSTNYTTIVNGNAEAMEVEPESSNELLNAVLACSFESNAIEQHLHQHLQLPQVRRLLQHLYVLISDPQAQLEERPSYEHSLAHTEQQALQWFGALLTSHFAQLTTSKDAKIIAVLTQWSKLMQQYADSIDHMQTLLPLLTNIVERRICKPKYDNKWYSIEEVVLY